MAYQIDLIDDHTYMLLDTERVGKAYMLLVTNVDSRNCNLQLTLAAITHSDSEKYVIFEKEQWSISLFNFGADNLMSLINQVFFHIGNGIDLQNPVELVAYLGGHFNNEPSDWPQRAACSSVIDRAILH